MLGQLSVLLVGCSEGMDFSCPCGIIVPIVNGLLDSGPAAALL
jgi:hypothetical protein